MYDLIGLILMWICLLSFMASTFCIEPWGRGNVGAIVLFKPDSLTKAGKIFRLIFLTLLPFIVLILVFRD